jgi:hypothetical protein
MKSEIQTLYITEEYLKQIVDLNQNDLKAYNFVKNHPAGLALIVLSSLDPLVLVFGGGFTKIRYLTKWQLFRKKQKKILEEIDKYNLFIKAIDINEQLLAAGNRDLLLSNKEKIIETLEITRENLICALKTEKILRENKVFIERNKDLLATNLTALQALQISQDAKEYNRLLNQSLDIAQNIQEEMKKLREG